MLIITRRIIYILMLIVKLYFYIFFILFSCYPFSFVEILFKIFITYN
nr:MAG TPA: hypothetical protein [Caudoviricetes sp.]